MAITPTRSALEVGFDVGGTVARGSHRCHLLAQTPAPQEPWPDRLVERPLRDAFPAPLPLNADGSAPSTPPARQDRSPTR